MGDGEPRAADDGKQAAPSPSSRSRLIAWVGRTLSPPFPRLVWAILLFALAAVVLVAEVDGARAWPVAALLFVGVLIAAVNPKVWQELLSRVEEAKIGPISLAIRKIADETAAEAPESDRGEGSERVPLREAESMFDLRVRLEAKLTYAAKHLLAEGDQPTFITVGSLVYDGFLSETEGRMAYAILDTRQEELDELPGDQRRVFLQQAGRFVDSVRATIFWGQVSRYLIARDLLLDRIPTPGRRDDFLVGTSEWSRRVRPALALNRNSRILARAINRVAGEERQAPLEGRPMIVVPDRSRAKESIEGSPVVVKFSTMREILDQD